MSGEKLTVGDVVRHRYGGERMAVQQVLPEGVIRLAWESHPELGSVLWLDRGQFEKVRGVRARNILHGVDIPAE